MTNLLRRWEQRYPRQNAAARWQRWAATLAGRGRRVWVGRLRAALTLARLGSRADRMVAYRSRWTLAPNIGITIHATAGRLAMSLDGARARMPATIPPPALGPRVGTIAPRRTGSVFSRPRIQARDAEESARSDRSPSRVGAASSDVPATRGLVRALVRPAGGSPRLVWLAARTGARPRLADRGEMPSVASSAALLDGRRVLRRVRDERQRVEQRAQQTLTMRARADGPGVTPPSSSASAPMVIRSPWGDQVGATGMAQPPLDVQGLTDQVVHAINKRTVAHRERLGRAF